MTRKVPLMDLAIVYRTKSNVHRPHDRPWLRVTRPDGARMKRVDSVEFTLEDQLGTITIADGPIRAVWTVGKVRVDVRARGLARLSTEGAELQPLTSIGLMP